MSERNYYVICDSNCKFPSMTKEQILTAIQQAVSTGEIKDVDTGFVTKVKADGTGENVSFWLGTEAEFNAITPTPDVNLILARVDENGKLYICKDDSAVDTMENTVYEKVTERTVPKTGGEFTGNISVPKLETPEIYLYAGQDKTGGNIVDYSYTIKVDETNHALDISLKSDNGTSPTVYTPILLNADGTATVKGTVTNATNAETATSVLDNNGNKITVDYANSTFKFLVPGGYSRPVDRATRISADVNSTVYSHWVNKSVWTFSPNTDGVNPLGNASNRWSTAYLGSAPVVSSDKNQKNSISDLTAEKAEKFVENLKPVTYKYNEGTSNRTHWGLISQDVESAMTAAGLTDLDFAGLIKSPKYEEIETQNENGETVTDQRIIDGEYTYALRYEEFIAPMLAVIKKQSGEIAELKKAVAELKKE